MIRRRASRRRIRPSSHRVLGRREERSMGFRYWLCCGLMPLALCEFAGAQSPPPQTGRLLADDLKALDGEWELPRKKDKEANAERGFKLTLKDGVGLLTVATKTGPDGKGLLGGLSEKEIHFEYTLAGGSRSRSLLANCNLFWGERISVLRCEIDGTKIKLKGSLKPSVIESENIDLAGEWAKLEKK